MRNKRTSSKKYGVIRPHLAGKSKKQIVVIEDGEKEAVTYFGKEQFFWAYSLHSLQLYSWSPDAASADVLGAVAGSTDKPAMNENVSVVMVDVRWKTAAFTHA